MKGKKPKKMDNHNHGVGCKKLKNDLEFLNLFRKNVSNNTTAIKQSVASIFSSSCSLPYDDV